MTEIIVVLQNAWRHNAKPGDREFVPGRPRERSDAIWRAALIRSRSGQRLLQMLPDSVWKAGTWAAMNASPFVGSRARSKYPYDADHTGAEIDRLSAGLEFLPVILLCGVEAQKAKRLVALKGHRIVLAPHPAYRLLSSARCLDIREELLDALRHGV